MDEHDQLSHPYRPDVYPASPRVYPPLGRARRVGRRRLAQQPYNWQRDGEHRLGAVLHRGRTRWFVFRPYISLPPTRINPTIHTVTLGESIASEGKGDYMYVEGRVLTSKGEPIPGAVIETWETDEKGEQSS